MRAVIIWKILLIGFHFDIRCEKVSNIMLKFSPLQFNYELNIWKYIENWSLTRSSELFFKYLGPQIPLKNGSVLKMNLWVSGVKWDWPRQWFWFIFEKNKQTPWCNFLKCFKKIASWFFAWFLHKSEASKSMVGVCLIWGLTPKGPFWALKHFWGIFGAYNIWKTTSNFWSIIDFQC